MRPWPRSRPSVPFSLWTGAQLASSAASTTSRQLSSPAVTWPRSCARAAWSPTPRLSRRSFLASITSSTSCSLAMQLSFEAPLVLLVCAYVAKSLAALCFDGHKNINFKSSSEWSNAPEELSPIYPFHSLFWFWILAFWFPCAAIASPYSVRAVLHLVSRSSLMFKFISRSSCGLSADEMDQYMLEHGSGSAPSVSKTSWSMNKFSIPKTYVQLR